MPLCPLFCYPREQEVLMENSQASDISNLNNNTLSLYPVSFQVSADSGSYAPVHWHDSVTLICLLEGELEITMGMQKTLLCGAQCMVINPMELHSEKCIQKNRKIELQIPLALIESYVPNAGGLQFFWDNNTRNKVTQTKIRYMQETLYKMQVVDEVRPEGYLLRFHSLLLEIIFQLCHNFSRECSLTDKLHRAHNLEQLRPAVQYLNTHYSSALPYHEVAALLGAEPDNFCRFFKKVIGLSYQDYLNEIRLSHLYHDLLTTEKPTSQLREEYGFRDSRLFHKIFFQYFKDSPGSLRRLHQGTALS